MCGFLLNSMYGTKDTATNLMAIVMNTLQNLKFEIEKPQLVLVQTQKEQETSRCFVTETISRFLQIATTWSGSRLARLDPDKSDLKEITLFNSIARYKQTKNGVPFLDGGT